MLAYERLSALKGNSDFLLIEPVPKKLDRVSAPQRIKRQADGVQILREEMKAGRAPDWIVPALPIHFAAEWCLASSDTKSLFRIPIPAGLEYRVPHPMQGSRGDLFVSYADFLCPEDCPEPRGYCTVSGCKRKQSMFAYLAQIRLPSFESLVLRSQQLAPGVGGYRSDQLLQLLSSVLHSQGNMLLSTACRCHGVVTALRNVPHSQ